MTARIKVQSLAWRVSMLTGVPVAEILGSGRRSMAVCCRDAVAYGLWVSGDYSYQEIANALGRTNHASAIHMVGKARYAVDVPDSWPCLARLCKAVTEDCPVSPKARTTGELMLLISQTADK